MFHLISFLLFCARNCVLQCIKISNFNNIFKPEANDGYEIDTILRCGHVNFINKSNGEKKSNVDDHLIRLSVWESF